MGTFKQNDRRAESEGLIARSDSLFNWGHIVTITHVEPACQSQAHWNLFKEAIVKVSEPVNYQFLLCQEVLEFKQKETIHEYVPGLLFNGTSEKKLKIDKMT